MSDVDVKTHLKKLQIKDVFVFGEEKIIKEQRITPLDIHKIILCIICVNILSDTILQ